MIIKIIRRNNLKISNLVVQKELIENKIINIYLIRYILNISSPQLISTDN